MVNQNCMSSRLRALATLLWMLAMHLVQSIGVTLCTASWIKPSNACNLCSVMLTLAFGAIVRTWVSFVARSLLTSLFTLDFETGYSTFCFELSPLRDPTVGRRHWDFKLFGFAFPVSHKPVYFHYLFPLFLPLFLCFGFPHFPIQYKWQLEETGAAWIIRSRIT